MANSKEMTGGAVFPLLFSFTMPLLLGNLLQQTYSLIDAAIVGKFLGINSLAAVGASTSVIFLILGFCNGCCAGFGIPVAQKFGARDYATMRRYVAVGLQLATVMSVVIAAVSGFYCRDILRGMQTPGNIFDGAYDYLFVTFIGIPFTFLYNLLSSLIRALGDSKTPFYFLLMAAILNIVLDLFCILILHWSVAGAAIATVFSQAVSALLCLYYMFRKFDILKMEKGETALDKHYIKGLLDMGVPMGLQFSITAIGSIMLQSANNALGTSCVAAFTAGMRIKMFFMCPLESMGIAMATYCGQNYGAEKTERINMGLRASFFMVCLYCIFCFIVLHLFARHIIYLFVDFHEYEIIEKANQFIVTSCTYFIPLGLLCLLRYSIQGLGYSKLAIMSGVFEMVDRTAVSLFLVPILGYTGVCYGDPSAWFAADLFLIPAYLYVHKRLSRKRCYAQAY